MIAMALVLGPSVLIADEPTTALDVTVQAQILELIAGLQHEFDTAVMLITHDLGVIAETADEVAVMYAGRVVEQGPLEAMLDEPEHPYTWGLLRSIPRLDVPRAERLRPIEGSPPSLIHPPSGCRFHPRCPYVMPMCRDDGPRAARVGGGPPRRVPPPRRREAAHLARAPARGGDRVMTALLEARDLVKHFPIRAGVLFDREQGRVHAVDGVSLRVERGETLGLVGETGCGKSTTARLLTRLLEPTSGEVLYDGKDITHWSQAPAPAAASRDADDLPGPVLVAEPAPTGRHDHRRAAPDPRHRARSGTAATASAR